MESSGNVAAAGIGVIFYIAIFVLMVASMWKLYTKAGQPGWAAIVPIYNIIVMLEIAGKPVWWLVLMLIPVVNIIVEIMILAGLAEKFGKGGGYVAGLIFLPFIFFPMLAFGDAEYAG